MFKKWLSCVLSVLCSFCMFWGLSSNTLEVKAAYVTQSISGSMDLYPNGGWTSGAGAISNGSGQVYINGTASGQYHVAIPLSYYQDRTNWSFSSTSINLLSLYITYWGQITFPTFSVSGLQEGTYYLSNVCICDSSHSLVLNSNGYFPQKTELGSNIFTADVQKVNLLYYLEFDFGFCDYGTATSYYTPAKITWSSGSWQFSFRDATSSEITSAKTQVNDTAANQSLDNIESSSQAIETSVTSDTGGGLLATIKNFFGGFFSNLINSIIGLFVPDSTYFSTWFDNLNTLLSAKLGMLYAPFDLLISTLNAVYSADTTEPGITFPGITWDGETVIEPYTFYFSSLGEDFQNLRDAVYFATDVVFLFAFLHLLQKKIALVITGSEVNG